MQMHAPQGEIVLRSACKNRRHAEDVPQYARVESHPCDVFYIRRKTTKGPHKPGDCKRLYPHRMFPSKFPNVLQCGEQHKTLQTHRDEKLAGDEFSHTGVCHTQFSHSSDW